MKRFKVLVFSATFGAGHLRAAEAIIEEIRKRNPAAEITHLDWGGLLSPTLNAMIKGTYIGMIAHTPRLWGGFYYGTARISPESKLQGFLNNMGKTSIQRCLQEVRPDLIICTYPTVAGVLAQMRLTGELSVPLVTVVTDYTIHSQWIHHGVDMYIVGCDDVSRGFISRGINPGCIHMTGIPVSEKFERAAQPSVLWARYGLHPGRPTLLIMAGAYGVLSHLKRVCRMVGNVSFPCQAIVVCGWNDRLYKSLDGVVDNCRNPILRFGYVNNVEDFMSISNVIVTKAGGLIVSESLTKHLPLIIFKPIPGQEEENAKFLNRNGAGRIAHNIDDLEQIILHLLKNPEELEQMRQAASQVLPGRSAERAVDLMLQLVEEHKYSMNMR
ncbi:MAG TPA: glycosyltransferase [Syntrophomonadaceae bacterium]|nr:glycosyltransferase [Syntrophomonadaceae bacterium]